MGTVVMGKVESGGVMKGASLLMMPNRVSEAYVVQIIVILWSLGIYRGKPPPSLLQIKHRELVSVT